MPLSFWASLARLCRNATRPLKLDPQDICPITSQADHLKTHSLLALYQVNVRKYGSGNNLGLHLKVGRLFTSSEQQRLLTEGETVLVNTPHRSSFVPDVPNLKHNSIKTLRASIRRGALEVPQFTCHTTSLFQKLYSNFQNINIKRWWFLYVTTYYIRITSYAKYW